MFGRQMDIAERHRGRRIPEEVADGGERHASHNEPGGKRMPQVVEMEIR